MTYLMVYMNLQKFMLGKIIEKYNTIGGWTTNQNDSHLTKYALIPLDIAYLKTTIICYQFLLVTPISENHALCTNLTFQEVQNIDIGYGLWVWIW